MYEGKKVIVVMPAYKAALTLEKTYQENSLTKYRLGSFETYQEAKQFRLQVLNTYKGAFVQALKNNEPIHILEALQE